MKVNAHPTTLVGKTVVLRANGKHNADNFLTRVTELLEKEVKEIKIIKAWEVAPETNTISQNPDLSKKFAETIASYKPDLVIASQCD
jgi:negative regulator of sigma E activity